MLIKMYEKAFDTFGLLSPLFDIWLLPVGLQLQPNGQRGKALSL